MHVLIPGRTLSGKTTLAKQLARVYRQNGRGVIVLDPLHDPEWSADFRTADPDEFLQVLWDSRNCSAFIDEAGEAVGRYNEIMNRTATKGRHWGHIMHYISQRVQQLPPIVRDQCTKLFLFASSAKDGKLLAEEFGHDELEQCNLLVTGEFFAAQKMGGCKRVNMFNLESRIDAATTANRRRVGNDGSRRLIGSEEKGRPAALAASGEQGNTAAEGNTAEGDATQGIA